MGNSDSVFASLVYGEEVPESAFEPNKGVVVSALLYGDEDFDIDEVDEKRSQEPIELPLEEEFHRLETPRLPYSWEALEEAAGLSFEERAAAIYCLLVGVPARIPDSNRDNSSRHRGGGLRRSLTLEAMLKWPQVATEHDEHFVRKAWSQIASTIVDPPDRTTSPTKKPEVISPAQRTLDFANFLRLLEFFEEEAASSSDSEAGECHDLPRRFAALSAGSETQRTSGQMNQLRRQQEIGPHVPTGSNGVSSRAFTVERAAQDDESGDDDDDEDGSMSSGFDPDEDKEVQRRTHSSASQLPRRHPEELCILPPLHNSDRAKAAAARGRSEVRTTRNDPSEGSTPLQKAGRLNKDQPVATDDNEEEPSLGCVVS